MSKYDNKVKQLAECMIYNDDIEKFAIDLLTQCLNQFMNSNFRSAIYPDIIRMAIINEGLKSIQEGSGNLKKSLIILDEFRYSLVGFRKRDEQKKYLGGFMGDVASKMVSVDLNAEGFADLYARINNVIERYKLLNESNG